MPSKKVESLKARLAMVGREDLDALLQDLLTELAPEFLAACSAADMQML